MRATILPQAIILTKVHMGYGQYVDQGVYHGLSTASEVVLILTKYYPTISIFMQL